MGSVSLSRLPVSLLPDVSLPVLTIRTVYTGAAAPEVSRFVAEPIEEAIAATPGLVELRSVSRNGEATTTARFAWGTDMRGTVLTVRERLDAARGQLPERAERPTLLTSDPGERPIAVLAMKTDAAKGGGDLRSLARTAADVHARRLEQIEGVASVAVVGAPEDQIRVDLDPDRLRALDLTPEDVAVAIRAQNATGAGGTIRKGQFRFSVRALTEFRTPSEILDTPVGPVGSGITLRDVGTVTLGLADPETMTRLDGAPAIGLVVYKDAGSNTVAVTSRMRESIDQLQKEFPAIGINVVAAQADFVVDALSNLGQEIVAGGLLSLLVILVFLRDWRVSLAIGLVVPLSVLVALVGLQAMGVSINVLSLGGLALGTGLLVDTAIVVAEAVGRRRDEGHAAHGCGHRRHRRGGGAALRRHAHHGAGVRAHHLRARPGGGAVPRPVAERGDHGGGVAAAGAHPHAGDDRGAPAQRAGHARRATTQGAGRDGANARSLGCDAVVVV